MTVPQKTALCIMIDNRYECKRRHESNAHVVEGLKLNGKICFICPLPYFKYSPCDKGIATGGGSELCGSSWYGIQGSLCIETKGGSADNDHFKVILTKIIFQIYKELFHIISS